MKKHSEHALSRVVHGGYLGGKETPEHYTWRLMVDRCTKPSHKAYQYYGGRGIKVCDKWLDYRNFLLDMGLRPSPAHSLDRLDNNKGYEKANCRWATRSEQQKNKATTRWYSNSSFEGTLVECAKHLGISKELAHWRFKVWGTFEKGVEWLELTKGKSKTR